MAVDLSPLADRCGRLTCHIVLPYSFLHYPNIDAAVRATYHKDIYGNCTMSESTLLKESKWSYSAGWNSRQRNESLSSVGMAVNETNTTVRQIEVATVSNPVPDVV